MEPAAAVVVAEVSEETTLVEVGVDSADDIPDVAVESSDCSEDNTDES